MPVTDIETVTVVVQTPPAMVVVLSAAGTRGPQGPAGSGTGTAVDLTPYSTTVQMQAADATVATNASNALASAMSGEVATRASADTALGGRLTTAEGTIATNTANIAANTTAIGLRALASDVATNTANIAANTTAIAGKVGTGDARLSDARTPMAHAASHASGGSDPVTPAAIGAAATSHTQAFSTITATPTTLAGYGITDAATAASVTSEASTRASGDTAVQAYAIQRANHTGTQAASTVTGLATVATSGVYTDLTARPTLGTAAALDVAASGNASTAQVVKGTDTRLSDARTPSSTLAHAASHASGGSDPVTPAAIGAAAASHTQAFSTITATPTTLAGYGITDAGTKAVQDTNTANIATNTSNIATNTSAVTANTTAIAQRLAAFTYTTGAYYDGSIFAGNSGTIALASGTLLGSTFIATETRTFDRIGVNVTTAGAAGTTIRLMLSAMATDGTPGALITDFGTVSGAAIAGVELTPGTAISLTAGTRYGLWVLASATVTISARTGGSSPALGFAALTGTTPTFSYSLAGTVAPANFSAASRVTTLGPSVRLRAI